MTRLRFTDGVEFETSGDYRIESRADGLYVVGHGFLCPVDSRAEGDALIARLAPTSPLFDLGMVTVQYDPNGSWHICFASGHRWDGWLDGESRISPALDD
jgi:hypothetical protein